MVEGGLPQLRMWIALDTILPRPGLAASYRVSVLEGGRLADWVAVLNSVGDLGEWTVERAQRATAMGNRAQVLADAICMAYCGTTPAATACLTAHPDSPDAELGWVAVHPNHRHRGLGRTVCTGVLQDMQRRGYEGAFLLTDDHRLAAIGLYWSLGFRPEIAHDSHGDRWAILRERLGLHE